MERVNSRKRWTDDADKELRQRIERRQTLPMIADGMGRTQDAIRGRAAQLKLRLPSTARPWRPGYPAWAKRPDEGSPS